MCGIAGGWSRARSGEEVALAVQDILSAQWRRGPDFQARTTIPGSFGPLVFGHNRLKILDLSDASNQPMWDSEEECCIVFNGEIYNYIELRKELEQLGRRFRTRGDTEVILECFKEWGTDCFGRFLGMFALAIWDRRENTLYLVRDRFGIKPLYYYQTPREIFFASTTAPLARVGNLGIDYSYIINGVETGTYDMDDEISPFVGLRSLSPAHFVALNLSEDQPRSVRTRYYDLENQVEALREEVAGDGVRRSVERFFDVFASAVSLRLRSDVPVGVSLSGGLDSSSVATLAGEQLPNLQAFTFGKTTDGIGEARLVEEFSRTRDMEVTYIYPTVAEISDSMMDVLRVQGAPFPGFSIVAQHYVFKAAREKGCIVLLGGQGGDEALMGYLKYRFFAMFEAREEGRIWDALKYGAGAGLALLAEMSDFSPYKKVLSRYRGKKIQSSLFPRPEGFQPLSKRYSGDYPLWKRQVLDVQRYSIPTLLRYEDRNSMENSVESRLPFLDHRLVELSIALPEKLKVHNGHGKWILRKAMEGRVPNSIRMRRRKKGFDVEEGTWVREGLGDRIRELLLDSQSVYADLLSSPVDLREHFSNESLVTNPLRMPEALALLWIINLSAI